MDRVPIDDGTTSTYVGGVEAGRVAARLELSSNLSRIVATAALVVAFLLVQGARAALAQGATRPFSVTITHVECVDDCDATGLEAALEGHADFYAKVFINGVEQTTPTIDNNPSIDPFWVVSAQVPDDVENVPVRIEIWDYDSTSGDDIGDVSPRAGDNTLDFRVSYVDGKWVDPTGNEDNVNWPQSCSTGNGGDNDAPRVKVCFDVSTQSTSGDSDGDGLLDGWELNGYNADGDGTIDVNLPAMGANPGRKDLFLEIDCLVAVNHTHCPVQGAIQSDVQAFANAPVPNTDGTSGIQLHVDIGNLYGQAPGAATNVLRTGAAIGGVTGTFGNYGGGGNQIPEAGNTIIDWDGAAGSPGTNFFTLKAANFNRQRDYIFRYAIFVHQTNARKAANDCTSGWAKGIPGVNFLVSLGGTNASGNACWGTDAGGNAVGTQNQQAGTLMHEFGHTLGLQHGGGDGLNNKPNYLSVMNYSFQACQVTVVPLVLPGGCDYSRIALPTLNEVNPPGLDECAGIGGGLGLGGFNWDKVGGLTGATCTPASANVQANINGDFNDTNGNNTQDPGETSIFGTLPGFQDWNNLVYNFHTVDNFQSTGTPVADEPDPDVIAAARIFLGSLLQPILSVDKTGPADANAGDTVSYGIDVSNTGSGPALGASLTDTKPDAGQASFDLGTLTVASHAVRNVGVAVPCATADGTVLTNSASAAAVDMLGNPVTGSDSVQTTVHTPVLTLAKSATTAVNAGDAITYQLSYQNTGSGAAASVTITDTLPADVYYSTALDQGSGPAPSSATRNANGTTTLTWTTGSLAGGSGAQTITYTVRPSLLFLGGSSVANSATLTFTNANGCTYAPVTASRSTGITTVPPSKNPLSPGYWKAHPEQWTNEILARIQATDQRFEGADGSSPDGKLSTKEVAAVFGAGGTQANTLRAQLLATYFNLATRRINAGTTINSKTDAKLGLHAVRAAALYARATLDLPVGGNTGRYNDVTLVLDEINNNKSESY
jgi:uncharacterized repeat protein (TIGR01451 family)